MRSDADRSSVHLGRVLITRDEIETRVRELAEEISMDYAGTVPVFISLLKGGFIFLADLVRNLTIPHEIDFITVSSYGSGLERSDRIEILNDLRRNVEGRDVIIIEDIVDTGHTLSALEQMLTERNVRSLRICTLLDKPSCREVDVSVHYVGFKVPDVFVVGYGLDFMERFRSLSYIAELVPGTTAEAPEEAMINAPKGESRESNLGPTNPPDIEIGPRKQQSKGEDREKEA